MKLPFILITFILFFALQSFSSNLKADIIIPEYFDKNCKAGEKETVCSFRSSDPFGARTYDECAKYANNPSYYKLAGHTSSFGGEERYCLKAGAKPVVDFGFANYFMSKNTILVLILTIVIEVLIALLMGYRKWVISVIILVNILTNPLINYLLVFNSAYEILKNQTLTLIILESLVILIEWLILKYALFKIRKSFLPLVLIMNWTSFMIGLVLTLFLSYVTI